MPVANGIGIGVSFGGRPGASGSSEFTPIAGTTNWLKANVPNALADFALVKAGTKQGYVELPGDSTTVGLGSTNANGSWVGAKTNSYPVQLAALLNTASIPANAANFFASSTAPDIATLLSADTRLSMTGTGWDLTGFTTVGGAALGNHTDTTSTFKFTVPDVCNTAELRLMIFSGAGVVAWSVDGGAETQINTDNASQAIGKFTIALGANTAGHVISLRVVSGSVFLTSITAFSSVTKRLLLLNQGSGGATTDALVVTGQGWNWEDNLNGVSAKLAFINMLLNDQGNNADPTGAMSRLQTVITALKATNCDPILVMPHPKAPSPGTVQTAYLNALKSLANTNNCPCLDLSSVYPFQGDWVGAGLDSGDGLHPNAAGYGVNAARIQALIAAIWAAA